MEEKDSCYHVPVMLRESLEGLDIRPDGIYVDVTFGGGGHSREILKRLGSEGELYGFDQDADAEHNIPADPRFTFVRSNFRYLYNFMRYYGESGEVDGLLADLGVSSHHFDDKDRGFSFRFDGALDMRMNTRAGQTAADIVNNYTAEALADVFYLYGELKVSRKLASVLVKARETKKIETIGDFLEVIKPFTGKDKEKKFLAQVFQALRIEVNDEMRALKEMLRSTLRNAMSEATTFDEFSALLLQQGVTVKESRGRLSYLTPDRTKPITARKLGDDFDRAAVLTLLEQNAHRAAEKTVPIPEYHTAETNRTERGKTQKIAPTGNIQRMVDRAAKRAEGKGIGYDRWAAVHNLKQMAATVAAMEQYGFTPDELDAALVSANADLHSSTAKLKPIETAIREKKDLQKQVLAYAKTRDVRDGLKKQKTDKARKAYREKHESDFIIADAAVRYFRQKGITKLPTYKSLQAEIEQLTAEKNALYNEYRANKERVRELQTMKSNLSQMHHGEPSRQKKHEQER